MPMYKEDHAIMHIKIHDYLEYNCSRQVVAMIVVCELTWNKYIIYSCMASYLSYMCIAVSRLSNHPNIVTILSILLENPESWPISDQDRKNPDFDIGLTVIFKWILRTLNTYSTKTDIRKTSKNCTRNIK